VELPVKFVFFTPAQSAAAKGAPSQVWEGTRVLPQNVVESDLVQTVICRVVVEIGSRIRAGSKEDLRSQGDGTETIQPVKP
jgi:hypothetical protein